MIEKIKTLAKPTKSPWKARPEKRVRRGYGQRYDVFGEEGFVAGDVSANDVGLIEAAPVLLAACKAILLAIRSHSSLNLGQLEAAIALAEKGA